MPGATFILGIALTTTLVGALVRPLSGQDPKKDTQRLEQLLKQLSGTKPATWKARMKALEAKAVAHDAKARSLRGQAASEAGKAAAARAEVQRVKQVMALLGPSKPTPKVAAKKAPAKKPVAKKPVTKKPPAKKKPAPKPASKPPPVQKPPPTKKPPMKPAPKLMAPKSMAPTPSAPAREFVTYNDHVQDIFMENCSACHDPDEKEGGLDLTTFATARAGGSSGTTIVPGDIDQSRLYQLVAHLQTPTMPPDEPAIDKKHIEMIRRWILDGAPEGKADATAFATAKQASAPKVVTLKAKFDGPAPMPRNWAKVAIRPTNRPVAAKTLATSARSELIAIPGDRQVFVLNSSTSQTLGILAFPHGDVEVLRFSADGSRLLVAGGTPGRLGRVVLYNVADGKVVGTYGREFDAVIAAAVHPQLSHIALGGSNRRVRVFDTGTGAMVYEIKDHDEWVLGIDFSSDGEFLVSVDRAGTIVLSEAKSGRNVDTIRRHRGAANAVCFAPDGRSYATVGDDRTLRLFSVKGAKQITQRNMPAAATSIAYSPDGKMIAVGCRDGRAHTFRSNGSPIMTLAPVGDWVYAVAFGKENATLFVGDWNGTTSVFDLKSRRRTAQLVPTGPRSQ